MIADLTIDLMNATVQVEQPSAAGRRTVAAGFLVADPTPDGRPRVVLVTAAHVFDEMPGDIATVGFRSQGPSGAWRYAPQSLAIRDHGRPLWTRDTSRDVAVIAIAAPPAFARAAVPLDWLAGDSAPSAWRLAPGETMATLGYPQGLAANPAGFPILRFGRIASFPLGPATASPTFLLDFRAFPGNSGGPVWFDDPGGDPSRPPEGVIAGLLTQQVSRNDQDLGLGVAVQAQFIREALGLLDRPPAEALTATASAANAAAANAAATTR